MSEAIEKLKEMCAECIGKKAITSESPCKTCEIKEALALLSKEPDPKKLLEEIERQREQIRELRDCIGCKDCGAKECLLSSKYCQALRAGGDQTNEGAS